MIALAIAVVAARPDFSALTARIESWVAKGYYPGASMVVVRDGRTLYERSFGNVGPDTVVLVASSGKWLAAATIARVVDEGRLSWNDRVDKWLPEFRDAKGRATLRQLLSHTSGFPDYQPLGAHVDDYDSLSESVAHIVGLPPATAPGARFQYGGLAMQVAGRMAELATGEDWETLFENRMARPLGMVSTRFAPVDKGGGHSPMLAGGARTTLRDYARFLDMIAHDGVFRGRRLLSKAAIREMEADHVGAANMSEERYAMRARGSLHNSVYGLGEWRERPDGSLLSSPSWAGAYPWIDRAHSLYGFFIAHVDGGPAGRDGFNSFYASPILPDLVGRALDRAAQGVRTGRIGGLAYEEAGRGEPVILLHAHSVDRRMWDEQFARLAKRYRVVRYDLRGYGESDEPTEGVPFIHADDLLRLMDGLHLPKAHLVGLSLGGLVATDFLALHPERVLSLAAAAGAIHDGEGGASDPAAIAKARAEGMERTKRGWLAALDGIAAHPERVRAAIWRMVDDWTMWQPTHVESAVLLDRPVAPQLRERKPDVPVLILVGAHDSPGSKASSARLAEALPRAKTVVLPDAGHFSNLDDPEGFDRALLGFLAEARRSR